MDNPSLLIKLGDKPGYVVAQIRSNDALIDSLEIGADRHFDSQLIEGVDKLLKKNRIDPLSLIQAKLEGPIDNNSSIHKIISAFLSALNASKIAD